MTETGHRRYADALCVIAARTGEPRLARLAESLRAPLRVGVTGRPGAGCRTVTRVLRGAGLTVVGTGEDRDVDVYVLAEIAKPEDRAVLAAPERPSVAVLNKADLTRWGGREPLAAAAAMARLLESQTGVPTRPLVGLLADPGVDDAGGQPDEETFAALGVLAAEPAHLGSTDAFVEGPHRLPRAVRERLLSRLDLFGIAHGVAAVRRGCGRPELSGVLRRLSGVAGLTAAVDTAAAPLRYRRIVETRPRLLELSRTPRVGEALTGDEVVLAAMAAAADVVAAAGMPAPCRGPRDELPGEAVRWQRYAAGPVTPLHRACGNDIARGALRLWAGSGGNRQDSP